LGELFKSFISLGLAFEDSNAIRRRFPFIPKGKFNPVKGLVRDRLIVQKHQCAIKFTDETLLSPKAKGGASTDKEEKEDREEADDDNKLNQGKPAACSR
jgi:hypothetical protein